MSESRATCWTLSLTLHDPEASAKVFLRQRSPRWTLAPTRVADRLINATLHVSPHRMDEFCVATNDNQRSSGSSSGEYHAEIVLVFAQLARNLILPGDFELASGLVRSESGNRETAMYG